MTTEKKVIIELTNEERETLTNAACILENLIDIFDDENCYKMTIEKEANINSTELDTAKYVTYTLGDYLLKWTAS